MPTRPRARAVQAELQADYVAEQSRYRTGGDDADGGMGGDGGSGSRDGAGVGMMGCVMVNEETTRLQVLLPLPPIPSRACAPPRGCSCAFPLRAPGDGPRDGVCRHLLPPLGVALFAARALGDRLVRQTPLGTSPHVSQAVGTLPDVR